MLKLLLSTVFSLLLQISKFPFFQIHRQVSVSLLILLAAQPVQAQQPKLPVQRFQTTGFVTGFGKRCANYEPYSVFFFAGDFSRSIRRGVKKDFVALYAEPQYNITATAGGTNKEYGVNFGFRNYMRINRKFYFYQMIGTGPHYISARLQTQASGFIFSDNLFLGLMKQVDSKRFINFQFGFRHISNAAIKMPNHGMNTLNLRVGISGLSFGR